MSSMRMLGLSLASGAAVAASQGLQGSVPVCVGADRVVRFEGSGRCPSGVTGFELALKGGKPEDSEKEAALQRQVDELKKKLAGLTERMADLQQEVADLASRGQAAIGTSVTAPFEVKTADGAVLLRVTSDQFVKTTLARVTIARGQGDNYSLFVRRPNGSVAAGIGQGNAGAGGLTVSDETGENYFVVSQNGLFLQNGKETVASLGYGVGRGGHFTLADPSGAIVVEAGANPSGIGVVRVGPQFRCGATFIRQPDCLVGMKQ